jgi:hypothetical protein
MPGPRREAGDGVRYQEPLLVPPLVAVAEVEVGGDPPLV